MPAGKLAEAEFVGSLYSEHHRWLLGWLRRKLGCPHDAADLAQDTFARVAGSQETQRLREPRAFLTTIAKGLVVNHWRRADIERAYLEALAARPPGASPSPEERALVVESLLKIDALLAALPERPRRAFLLSQLDGLTYREIATELGVSERMVKKYMASTMLHCLTLE